MAYTLLCYGCMRFLLYCSVAYLFNNNMNYEPMWAEAQRDEVKDWEQKEADKEHEDKQRHND